MKVSVAIESYINDIRLEQNLSIKTISEYKRMLSLYEEYLMINKVYKIEWVKFDTIQKYYSYLNYHFKYSQDSIYLHMSVIRSLHKYIHYRYDIKNEAEYVELPKRPERLPIFLSRSDIEVLSDHYKNDLNDFDQVLNKTIIECLYGLGLRVSELTKLQVNRINFTGGYIMVTGKGNKDRYVPIPAQTLDQMIFYFENVRPKYNTNNSKLFLVNKFGRPVTNSYVQIMIKTAASECKLKKGITPHKLRHTYATHLMENGADIRTIQELLGHSSINTTTIYTHCDTERLKNSYFDAMNKNFQSHNDSCLKLST